MLNNSESFRRDAQIKETVADTLDELERIRPDSRWEVLRWALNHGDIKLEGFEWTHTPEDTLAYKYWFQIDVDPDEKRYDVKCHLVVDWFSGDNWYGSGTISSQDLEEALETAVEELWNGDQIQKLWQHFDRYQQRAELLNELLEERGV